MKAEVLFISAPKYGLKQYSDFLESPAENSPADLFSASAYMPLGLLAIQSYVQKNLPEIHTSLIAMDGLIQTNMMVNGVYRELQSIVAFKERYFEKLLEGQVAKTPHMIGVSSMFDVSVEAALMIVRILRKKYPDSTIILGGHPATSKYRRILELAGDDLDAISYGEGEKPFVRLLKASNYRKELLKDS